MRAIVLDKKLRLDPRYPDPEPGEGECLVRVHFAGICATDLEMVRGYEPFTGVLGHEFAGTVVEGSAAWMGKRVACEINCVCRECDMCLAGLAIHCRNRTTMGISGRDGCFADLVAAPEHNLHELPDAVSDQQAVFVEPLAAAYQVLAQCRVDRRMKVSVIGPGRLGLLVAQVLATTKCRLTAVGRSAKKLDLCEKKGIQAIHVKDLVAKHDQDVVVECSGSPDGLKQAIELVRPRGTIILKSTYAGGCNVDLTPIVVNEVNVLGSRCGPFGEAINALARGSVDVDSMISRTFTLEKAVEAFEAAGNPRNIKILLKINPA